MLTRKGQKSPNDFEFGTLTGRFPNDGAASVAVKGLIKHKRFVFNQSEKKMKKSSVYILTRFFFFCYKIYLKFIIKSLKNRGGYCCQTFYIYTQCMPYFSQSKEPHNAFVRSKCRTDN